MRNRRGLRVLAVRLHASANALLPVVRRARPPVPGRLRLRAREADHDPRFGQVPGPGVDLDVRPGSRSRSRRPRPPRRRPARTPGPGRPTRSRTSARAVRPTGSVSPMAVAARAARPEPGPCPVVRAWPTRSALQGLAAAVTAVAGLAATAGGRLPLGHYRLIWRVSGSCPGRWRRGGRLHLHRHRGQWRPRRQGHGHRYLDGSRRHRAGGLAVLGGHHRPARQRGPGGPPGLDRGRRAGLQPLGPGGPGTPPPCRSPRRSGPGSSGTRSSPSRTWCASTSSSPTPATRPTATSSS